jgi:DNA modification methylase
MRYYSDDQVTLHHGDALDVLRTMPDGSVDSCVTSPPYFGLRDYGEPGQYGLEASPAEYVETMRSLFAEVRRVLADDGTLWLNLGDSYSVRWASQRGAGRRGLNDDDATRERSGAIPHGVPEKNLLGMPWRVAFALQDDGWILRNAIVWHKPNAMPESVTDRMSCRYEHLFLFSKSRQYWFDLDPIREPLVRPEALTEGITFDGNKAAALTTGSSTRRTGNRYGSTRPWVDPEQSAERSANPLGRNPGDVWTISTKPFAEAHFAVMPPELAERCILAGCKPGGTVLDPFSGSGTTGMVAQRHGRKYVGIDLNKDYLDLSLRTRLQQAALDFEGGAA